MRRHLTPWRIIGVVISLLVVTVVILFAIPSGQYILLPDVAHPVAPLVQVHGSRPAKAGSGKLYFVDVLSRRATELEALFPWIRPHGSLLPAGDVIPPCATATEAEAAQLREMALSQRVAAAVALRRLGYHVVVKPTGVIVSQLIANTHSPCNLQPMDVVVSVNGTPTPTEQALHNVLSRVDPGSTVELGVRRGSKLLNLHIPTVDDHGRALIGFVPDQAAMIKLPIRVAIDTHDIGGPSAGLAFALEVMQKLGRNVLHGHKVAATGEIELNGGVGEIGGIKQKTYGVRQAGADVFLVPAQNAADARKFAGPVRIIPVRTFSQALRALATLPSAQ